MSRKIFFFHFGNESNSKMVIVQMGEKYETGKRKPR
jgi:hypothetical protein